MCSTGTVCDSLKGARKRSLSRQRNSSLPFSLAEHGAVSIAVTPPGARIAGLRIDAGEKSVAASTRRQHPAHGQEVNRI